FPHRRKRPYKHGRLRLMSGNCPKAHTGSSPHDLFDHNVKAAFVEVLCGFTHGVGPPSSRWGSPSTSAPQARGVHGLPRHVEYHTVADAVIETGKGEGEKKGIY